MIINTLNSLVVLFAVIVFLTQAGNAFIIAASGFGVACAIVYGLLCAISYKGPSLFQKTRR